MQQREQSIKKNSSRLVTRFGNRVLGIRRARKSFFSNRKLFENIGCLLDLGITWLSDPPIKISIWTKIYMKRKR
jgi:hypothetical protein